MKRLTFLFALLCLDMQAQNLVVFDAGDLYDNKSEAHVAVLTEVYCQSADWEQMQERIWHALEAKYTGVSGPSTAAVKKAICSHAVGGRMYHVAEVLENQELAKVRDKSWEEADKNAWGVIDANGRTVVPCRYEIIDSYGNIIIASREINFDKALYEVRLYRPDGSFASDQQFSRVHGNFNVSSQENAVSVRFTDGGWGLINGEGRVITTRKYDEIGTGDKLFYDSPVTDLWAKRGGKMYLLSPVDGHETGTFTYTHRDHEDFFTGVVINWF